MSTDLHRAQILDQTVEHGIDPRTLGPIIERTAAVQLPSSYGHLARAALVVRIDHRWSAFGLIIWMLIYLYKAMRRVYGQGRRVTGMKFILLGVGYLINFVISLVLLVAFVALQNRIEGVDWKEAIRATGATIRSD